MLLLMKILAIAITVIGVIFLFNPKAMNGYIAFWKQGKRLFVGGIVNILLGILFLKVASQCRISGFITAMGIISLIKGIVLVVPVIQNSVL